jgi:N-acetylglucosamine-6-phosphate deacetylase
MGPSELVSDAQVVTGGEVVRDGWVLIEDGVIRDVGDGARRLPPSDVNTSASGAYVLPGFIDIHVHGGGGGSFGADLESTQRAVQFHLWEGTTALLAGISTCPPSTLLEIVQQLGALPEELGSGSRLLGIHLEGPFISRARKGAQDPNLIRPPDPSELLTLLDAAPGRIRLITAAPELAGFYEIARVAQGAGAVVGAGHTDADGPQFRSAIAAGARTLTHTFNGMRPVLHRSPGPMEAIVDTGVFCELICDGVHVHPTFVRMLRRLVGTDRLVLITDAAKWAGAPSGEYQTNNRMVEVRDGAVFLRGAGTLSGSTLTLGGAARRYIEFTGADFVELAAVTATNAARVLGEDHRLGRIEPGHKADLVLLDAEVNCVGVMSAGRWARRPGGQVEHPPSWAMPGHTDLPIGECPCGDALNGPDQVRASSLKETGPR